MKQEGNVFVYEHWRPDTNSCFYVGKGRKRRLREKCKRNVHHTRIVNKLRKMGLDFEVKIIASGLSDAEAFKIEIEQISYWHAKGIVLANQTDGGDGPINPAEEVRQKIREARALQVYDDNYRRRHLEAMSSPEVRARLSISAKRPGRKNGFAGKKHSAETKQRWSEKRKGKRLTPEHREKISAGLRRTAHAKA